MERSTSRQSPFQPIRTVCAPCDPSRSSTNTSIVAFAIAVPFPLSNDDLIGFGCGGSLSEEGVPINPSSHSSDVATAWARSGDRTAPTVSAVRVYLVQHGQAKPEDEDSQRPLTDRGADDVRWVAQWAIDRFGVRPSRIIHSGKTRARETAQIWGRLSRVETEQGDGLAPDDDPTTWVRQIAAEVMLVGHLPHLAKLASLLLTGDVNRQLVGFRQGGLVAAERTESGWAVTLVLPPSAG